MASIDEKLPLETREISQDSRAVAVENGESMNVRESALQALREEAEPAKKVQVDEDVHVSSVAEASPTLRSESAPSELSGEPLRVSSSATKNRMRWVERYLARCLKFLSLKMRPLVAAHLRNVWRRCLRVQCLTVQAMPAVTRYILLFVFLNVCVFEGVFLLLQFTNRHHFTKRLSQIELPYSSYSAFVTHSLLKVWAEATMEPPFQAQSEGSSGIETLTCR